MKLNRNQLKQLSGFTSDLSIVFFATVITPVFADPKSMNPLIIVSGLTLSLGSLFISMVLLKSNI